MKRVEPPIRGWSRRAVLSTLGWPILAQVPSGYPGQSFDADARRYPDPSTEFEVYRLTDPKYESRLSASGVRSVSRKGDFLVYSTARSGSLQLHRMELKGYQSRQLTQVSSLQPDSIGLHPDDKNAICFADGKVQLISTNNGKDQTLAEVAGPAELSGGPTVTEDGNFAFWAEASGDRSILRMLRLPRGSADKLLEVKGRVRELTANPRRATLLWLCDDGSLWLAAFDGTGLRQVQTPPGTVNQALWSPDGRAILYLHVPDDSSKLNSIREQELDARTDRPVASTSQFVRFARNANATVFLGGSRSKASPNMLLLLRVTRREFTLCEHRSGDPLRTTPMFTPNSQRILFESDRDGKAAVYSMQVEKLVEKTES